MSAQLLVVCLLRMSGMGSKHTTNNCAIENASYAVGTSASVRRDTDLPGRNSRVSNHGRMKPSFSGRTTKRDVSEQVVNLMMGEVPVPETLLVVSLAKLTVGWQTSSRSANSSESSSWDGSLEGEDLLSSEIASGRWLSYRQSQMLLRMEGGEEGLPVDCCPSMLEMVEPVGGKNREDMYVELYRDGEIKQRFFDLSCRKGVEGKPCRFMDRKLHNQSRCIQKYSYSYAIVKSPQGEEIRHHHKNRFSPLAPGTNWSLDYIKIRSGCSCEVSPKLRKSKRNQSKSKRGKFRRTSDEET